MVTHIHVSREEEDRARLKVVWNDDLGVLAIVVLAHPHFWSGKLNELGRDTAVSVGIVFPLVKVGSDRCTTEVCDFCSAQFGGLDC